MAENQERCGTLRTRQQEEMPRRKNGAEKLGLALFLRLCHSRWPFGVGRKEPAYCAMAAQNVASLCIKYQAATLFM